MKKIFSIILLLSALKPFIANAQDFRNVIQGIDQSNKEGRKRYAKIESDVLDPKPGFTNDTILFYINRYFDVYENANKVSLSDEALDKIFEPIFTKAVGNSDGIIKNGSALSYVIDKDKSTISINHAMFLRKFYNQILNINVNGNSEGDYVNILSSTKYNYGLETSFKFSKRLWSNLKRDRDHVSEFSKIRQKELYYPLLAKYKQILKSDTNRYKTVIDSMDILIDKSAVLTSTVINHKVFKKQSDTLAIIRDSLKTIRNVYKLYRTDKLRNDLLDQIATFEKEKSEVTVYEVRWFDYGIGYKLLSNAIFDSTIYKIYKVAQKQFHRVTLTLSYNYFFRGTNNLLYICAGVKLFNGYALENQTLSNINIRDTTGIQEYSYRAYNNLANKNLNETYFTTNPYVNIAWFPGKNRQFGFELAAENKLHDYSAPVYDGRFGVLYSLVDKEDKEKNRSTVGVFMTLNKYDSSNPRIEDFVGIGFRVGLPFSGLFDDKK